jgi:hypothetical protein
MGPNRFLTLWDWPVLYQTRIALMKRGLTALFSSLIAVEKGQRDTDLLGVTFFQADHSGRAV